MADERGPEPGATREPGGTPETGPGQQQHPLTRAITVAIVLVSLAIAAVGYLQVQASRKSSDAGQEAQRLTPLTSNSQHGPPTDPDFPRHFFARSTQGALEQQGLEDAATATNSGWESLAARYTAILTLFAVALYLLGFAMALPDRVLRLFGAIGAFLLVVGVAWAVQVTLSAPSTIPADAATEYAQGEVALETATDAPTAQFAVEH